MDRDTEFYLFVNNEEAGPFSFDQLVENGLTPEALVWWNGLDNWVVASNVPEFQPIMPATATKPQAAAVEQPQEPVRQPQLPQQQEPSAVEEPVTVVPATVPCPYCGEAVNAASRKCPYCGEWLQHVEPGGYSGPVSQPGGYSGPVSQPGGSLMPCPDCGQMISGRATSCPHCGCPLERMSFCTECGAQISRKALSCPHCGTPVGRAHAGHDDGTGYPRREKSKSKLFTILGITLLVLALAGAGVWWFLTHGEKEVRTFVAQFAAAVENGDEEVILAMYPDAENADSLVMNFDPDMLKVKKRGDNWEVSMSDEWTIMVARSQRDHALYIRESQGVFAFPDQKLAIAKGTGWYDEDLTDAENAERLADGAFLTWLENKAFGIFQEKVKITKTTSEQGGDLSDFGFTSYGNTYCTVEISNQTSRDIEGNAYSIQAKETYDYYGYDYDDDTHQSGPEQTLSGKIIPARGTATYTWEGVGWHNSMYSRTGNHQVQAQVELSPSLKKVAMEIYEPTGQEYKEYKSSHR